MKNENKFLMNDLHELTLIYLGFYQTSVKKEKKHQDPAEASALTRQSLMLRFSICGTYSKS